MTPFVCCVFLEMNYFAGLGDYGSSDVYDDLYDYASRFNQAASGGLKRAARVGSALEDFQDLAAVNEGRGPWRNAGILAGGALEGLKQVGSGMVAGGSLGTALNPGIGTAIGGGLGGLLAIPGAAMSVWDAIQEVRRGGRGGRGFTASGMDVPRDLQMLDTELLYDRASGRGYGPQVPQRRATPGYMPEDAMYYASSFDMVPQSYGYEDPTYRGGGRRGPYYPMGYQYQLGGYDGPYRPWVSSALERARRPARDVYDFMSDPYMSYM